MYFINSLIFKNIKIKEKYLSLHPQPLKNTSVKQYFIKIVNNSNYNKG